MRHLTVFVFTTVLFAGVVGRAAATPVLQEVALNVDGAVYTALSGVPSLSTAGFDAATGLGTLVLTFTPGVAGSYGLAVFFNHDLDAPFFDEFGAAVGAPGAGQTWQIDEPGYGTDFNRTGTIYSNLLSLSFDDTNYVPGTSSNLFNDCGANGGGAVDASCNNDVALGMGYAFALAANEQAVITWTVSDTTPASGFYLWQVAPRDPVQSIFLTSALSIRSTEAPAAVPEPGTLILTGTALLGLARARARKGGRR